MERIINVREQRAEAPRARKRTGVWQFIVRETKAVGAEIREFWKNSWKRFLLLAGLLAIVYLAIIIADTYYWDDIFREIQGFRGWQDFSRHASNYLAILLNTSGRLIDISPLSHILAILFSAMACTILIYLFKVKLFRKKVTAFDYMAAMVMFISPYFLECFVYKFDSPYMAISVLAMVAPFLLLSASRFWYLVTAFFGTILMTTTYQASSGILPILVIAVGLAWWHNGEKVSTILKFLIGSAVAYGAGILVFKTFLMAPIDPNYADYVSNSVFPLGEMASGVIGNLGTYAGYVFGDFRRLWLVLIAGVAGSFVVFSAVNSRRNKVFGLIVSAVAAGLIGVLMFGLYPALEKPSFDPRAFLGLGAAVSVMMLYVSGMKYGLPGKLIGAGLWYCFVVFAFIYGNALREQDDWNRYRNETLARDLAEMPVMQTSEEKRVKIVGNIGYAKAISNYVSATGCGVLERLSFVGLQDSKYDWGYYYLLNYYGLENVKPDKSESGEISGEMVRETAYHAIYVDGNHITVKLK